MAISDSLMKSTLLMVPFMAAWLAWSLGFPLLLNQPVLGTPLYLGWAPGAMGLLFALMLTGDWPRRFARGAAMPVLPLLVSWVFFASGTDAWGVALTYAAVQCLCYGVGLAVGVGIAQLLRGRIADGHGA